MKLFDRLKTIIQKLIVLLSTTAINLNMFPASHFGDNVNRATAKRLGQWTTRLYILLLIVTIGILALYTIVQPQTLTIPLNKLDLAAYDRLKRKAGDRLNCPCSSIATPYKNLVAIISPKFHQVSTYHYLLTHWFRKVIVSLEICVVM